MESPKERRILVIDDEPDVTDLLHYHLEAAGYQVDSITDPLRVMSRARSFNPDLIILDIMMPELSGLQVLQMLKSDEELKNRPVIFLTAKGEAEDRVIGFESGVDDYIAKPFDTREVLLRIRAILTRLNEKGGKNLRRLRIGNILADKDLHQLYVDQEPVLLTATEFKLVQLLMENKNKVQSRQTLLSRVWNYEASTETRTVDTHIRRLREKLGKYAHVVETIRGVGYRMVDPAGENEDSTSPA
ncbi:MAG: response regulator transcription factor [Puniceicoccaceae bacterium]